MMKKILKTIILLIILSFMLVMINFNNSNAVNDVKKNISTSESSSNFKTTNEVVYTKGTTYLRKNPVADEISQVKLAKDVELIRTGYSTSQIDGYSWSKVTYKGAAYYCLTYMLTTSKPNEVAKANNSTVISNTDSDNTNVTNENIVINQTKNEASNEISNVSQNENVEVLNNEVEEGKDVEQISEDPQKAAKEKAEKIRKLIFEVVIAIVVILIVVSIIFAIKNRRDSDYYDEEDDEYEDDNNYEEDEDNKYIKSNNSNMEESSEYKQKQALGYDEIFGEKKEKNTRNENFDEKLERIRKRQQEESSKNKKSINKGKHF